jgi:hypothetical protein
MGASLPPLLSEGCISGISGPVSRGAVDYWDGLPRREREERGQDTELNEQKRGKENDSPGPENRHVLAVNLKRKEKGKRETPSASTTPQRTSSRF